MVTQKKYDMLKAMLIKQRKKNRRSISEGINSHRKFLLKQSPNLDIILQEILQRVASNGMVEEDPDGELLKKYKSKMLSALKNFYAQEDYLDIRKSGSFFQAIIFDEESDDNARQYWMKNPKCKIFVDLVQKYIDQIDSIFWKKNAKSNKNNLEK